MDKLFNRVDITKLTTSQEIFTAELDEDNRRPKFAYGFEIILKK